MAHVLNCDARFVLLQVSFAEEVADTPAAETTNEE